MKAHVARALQRAGCQLRGGELASFAGAELRWSALPSGRAALWVCDQALAASSCLAANPELGWSWGLLHGQLVRRVALGPRTWSQPGQLAAQLELLVSGLPAAGSAAHRELLLPLVEEPLWSLPPEVTRAAALTLLARDAADWTGARYLLRGSLQQALLVGDAPRHLRRRAQQDASVLRALAARPDAARAMLNMHCALPELTPGITALSAGQPAPAYKESEHE